VPRLKNSTPKYRLHKATGQAIVTLDGQDFYLGPYGSRPSRREYERLIGEWLQNGRSLPTDPHAVTIAELINAYRKHAEAYYVKNGQSTGTAENMRPVMRLLRGLYGDSLVKDFGPLALKAVRQKLIGEGQARMYVNENVERIRRMFKWAAGDELIPFEVYHRLTAVEGLRKGRTEAHETPPIPPVADEVVEHTVPHLSTVVADMVRFQRLTGCRPGEVCILRPFDVDTSGDVWTYRPESHKTEHHDRDRIIMIGPQAQDVLRPYLLRESQAYCFCPADSERKRRQEAHEQRATPLKYGNRPGTNRKRKPKRSAGDSYTNDSYRRAIHRACDKAFPAPAELSEAESKEWRSRQRWSPNQLRHTAATEIRRQFGLEAAQVTLGHSNANVTQIYAERDLNKAAEIMRAVG